MVLQIAHGSHVLAIVHADLVEISVCLAAFDALADFMGLMSKLKAAEKGQCTESAKKPIIKNSSNLVAKGIRDGLGSPQRGHIFAFEETRPPHSIHFLIFPPPDAGQKHPNRVGPKEFADLAGCALPFRVCHY